ncbi:hypothetical protein GXW82_10335 [Streptacidiphilus sp. 4-A2]|nr:hypothetical protein [Streptacidiphilus sp. 4-A2]
MGVGDGQVAGPVRGQVQPAGGGGAGVQQSGQTGVVGRGAVRTVKTSLTAPSARTVTVRSTPGRMSA